MLVATLFAVNGLPNLIFSIVSGAVSTADRIAPVPTTHNPVAFFIVSFVALAFNLGVAIYQFRLIKKNHLNPLKDEIYKDTKAYQEVIEENV